jgi:hypothetical protein
MVGTRLANSSMPVTCALATLNVWSQLTATSNVTITRVVRLNPTRHYIAFRTSAQLQQCLRIHFLDVYTRCMRRGMLSLSALNIYITTPMYISDPSPEQLATKQRTHGW